MWPMIENLLRNPPRWLLAVLVAVGAVKFFEHFSAWPLIEHIIQNPPVWVMAVLGAIAAIHFLEWVTTRIFGKRLKPPLDVIVKIEMLVVFVLSYISIHKTIPPGDPPSVPHDGPLPYILTLGIYSLISMIVYVIVIELRARRRRPRSPRSAPQP